MKKGAYTARIPRDCHKRTHSNWAGAGQEQQNSLSKSNKFKKLNFEWSHLVYSYIFYNFAWCYCLEFEHKYVYILQIYDVFQ